MAKITLEDYLKKHGDLSREMMGCSKLIDKLEIYGFVNTCKDQDIFEKKYQGLFFNDILSKEPKLQIIMSEHIYQITSHLDGTNIVREGRVVQIYAYLHQEENEAQYNIKDLYIPSLVNKDLYKNVKSRRGNGVTVNNYGFEKAKLPECYKLEEGQVFLVTSNPHIQCLDSDGVIKSIAENILVVCRYLHPETGTMCYTQYNLNEVWIDDVH